MGCLTVEADSDGLPVDVGQLRLARADDCPAGTRTLNAA
ncbi:hypothetical protein MOTT27_00025 [Mycobacterium intracellulare subsp. yongonense]|nr:hypothetical protein MOTT27_00025 [Mycobacterium intracellulare subsp. yongonense]